MLRWTGLAPVLVTVRPDASPELLEAVSGFDARGIVPSRPDAHLGQAESLRPASGALFHALPALLRAPSSSLGISRWSGRAGLVRELTAFYLQNRNARRLRRATASGATL